MEDEELNNIKKEWLESDRTEQSLSVICDNHNIMIDDFLYLDGYNDFKSLIEDIKKIKGV